MRTVRGIHAYLDDGYGNIENLEGRYFCRCGYSFPTVEGLQAHIRLLGTRIAGMVEDDRDRLIQQVAEQIDQLEQVLADLDSTIAALQRARTQTQAALIKYQKETTQTHR